MKIEFDEIPWEWISKQSTQAVFFRPRVDRRLKRKQQTLHDFRNLHPLFVISLEIQIEVKCFIASSERVKDLSMTLDWVGESEKILESNKTTITRLRMSRNFPEDFPLSPLKGFQFVHISWDSIRFCLPELWRVLHNCSSTHFLSSKPREEKFGLLCAFSVLCFFLENVLLKLRCT